MITIVDYGMGNLRSVSKALDHLGFANRISSHSADLASSDRVILPGVGAFGECVRGVRSRGLEQPVKEFVKSGRPFLGICVGMQILAETSEESPEDPGLNLVEGSVPRFKSGLKIPHMGWNSVAVKEGSRLFKGIKDGSHFYFVHSYFVRPASGAARSVAAESEYGQPFAAALEQENLFATQFHPEKSQRWGLQLLSNFAQI